MLAQDHEGGGQPCGGWMGSKKPVVAAGDPIRQGPAAIDVSINPGRWK